MKMIIIDGSYGEGGGQILRTSLSLSLLTGKPFSIHNIRAKRKKPGLMRQHLTAVNAAAEIGGASIHGNVPGSTTFTFKPGGIHPGKYLFSVGTAGSCTLVFQTVLPALLMADAPSEIRFEGGTHNPFAPPFDFLDHSFLPLIRKMGGDVTASLLQPGFYPAGGGRFDVSVNPSKMNNPVDLRKRGACRNKTACAMVSDLSVKIAQRELGVVRDILNWPEANCREMAVHNAKGPGNVLVLSLEYENITAVFAGFGERGVSAENVSKRTIGRVKEYLTGDAVVEKYLADQLLLPMAMGGGGIFRTLSPSKHTMTNIEIIKKFLDVEIRVMNVCDKCFDIEILP